MSIFTFFIVMMIGISMLIPPITVAIYYIGKRIYRILTPIVYPRLEIIAAHISRYSDAWMLVGCFLIGSCLIGYALATVQKIP